MPENFVHVNLGDVQVNVRDGHLHICNVQVNPDDVQVNGGDVQLTSGVARRNGVAVPRYYGRSREVWKEDR